MSGTITLNTGITHSNGSGSSNLAVNVPSENTSITQAAQEAFSATQSVPTSDTEVTTEGITTLGVMVIKNLDAANFIDIGVYVAATAHYFMRILAGERYPVRLVPGITIYGKADTAAVKIQKWVYGN